MADQLWFSITIRNTVVIAWLALGVAQVGAAGGTDAVLRAGTGAAPSLAPGDAGTVDGALAALIAGTEAVARVAIDPGDGCTVQASKNKSGTSTRAGVRQHLIGSPSHRLRRSFSVA